MKVTGEPSRRNLYNLLGDLPPRDRRISVKLISKEERDGYILEKLLLDINGFEPVPAYFAKPLKSSGPTPCIIYNHAHGGNYVLGKDELINGRDALQSPPYAKVLTDMGYSVFCMDTWLFGERRGRTESEVFKEMIWKGQVLWGMMVYDNIRAIDYIGSRKDVDMKRIGTMGISMGSTMAWWTAALDTRVKVCVDICCLTDFEAIIESRNLDGHGIYYFVPSLLKHFSTAQINALIAPRPHLSLAGIYDRLTPLAGLDKIDRELKKVYGEMGAKDSWKLSKYDIGHFETAAMRSEILGFLEKHI
jgi:hypothetical protein